MRYDSNWEGRGLWKELSELAGGQEVQEMHPSLLASGPRGSLAPPTGHRGTFHGFWKQERA